MTHLPLQRGHFPVPSHSLHFTPRNPVPSYPLPPHLGQLPLALHLGQSFIFMLTSVGCFGLSVRRSAERTFCVFIELVFIIPQKHRATFFADELNPLEQFCNDFHRLSFVFIFQVRTTAPRPRQARTGRRRSGDCRFA